MIEFILAQDSNIQNAAYTKQPGFRETLEEE